MLGVNDGVLLSSADAESAVGFGGCLEFARVDINDLRSSKFILRIELIDQGNFGHWKAEDSITFSFHGCLNLTYS